MDTLQCAIVLAKLERFDWEITQRLAIGQHDNYLLDELGQEYSSALTEPACSHNTQYVKPGSLANTPTFCRHSHRCTLPCSAQ